MYAISISKTYKKIIARTVATRPPENRYLLIAEMVAPAQQLGSIDDVEAEMVNAWLAQNKHDGVMGIVAAQPGTFAQEPVGEIEAERFGIEFNHCIQMHGMQCDMLQGIRLHTPPFNDCKARAIERNRNFDAVAIWIIKPERI